MVLIPLFVLAACGGGETPIPDTPTAGSQTLFANVSRQAGVVHTRQGNDRAIGQAWGDYDRDGWLDFYVTDTAGPNTLFHNNGDGTFAVSPLAGTVAVPDGYSGGASFADYDNDGWLDLYVVNWGGNVLFHNEKGQGFTDVTAQAGVGDAGNGQTASWGDYDNDGWLDLYVANWACYPECGRPSQGDSDRLYHNNGDGTFSDVTPLLNGEVYGAGFIASFTDYDNDGDQDIYLVNDEFLFPIGNKLWRNDGPGCDGHCFTQVATEANADTQVMGMGLATTDYDNDGDFDFYFSNVGPMTLLQNQGDGTFQNVAAQAGVEMPDAVTWGAAALDYDNDGWQDLYLAVMTTADHSGLAASPLFHNNGDGTFMRIRSGSGASDVGPTMSAATADFDNDGWVDMLIGNKDDGYSLLRNQVGQQSGNHWFTLELVGDGPVNRDAVGTRVTVKMADGSQQVREVRNGSGLGGGDALALHFGLGSEATVSQLMIAWPDGRIQQFQDVPADRQVTLTYPVNVLAEAIQQKALYPVAEPEPNPAMTYYLLTAVLIIVPTLLLTILFMRYKPIHWGRSFLLRWSTALIVVVVVVSAASFWLLSRKPAAEPAAPAPIGPDPTLAELLAAAGVTAPERLPSPPAAKVALGEALFWDPLLSGNKDTSCATCHHPREATGDGLSLPIGTGGQGIGPERVFVNERQVLVPRNATPVFNLGLAGMDVMFWDGRVQGTPETNFASPADDDLPDGLENAVAVQAMFPVTSRDEMRGQRGDKDLFSQRNELASISDHNWPAIWDGLMTRILAVPAYQEMFRAVYPGVPLDELGFEYAANAIAAYQMEVFTFLDSPWDRYLQGDETALSPEAMDGALLFYGKANCVQCHSGPLMTDLQFHNIGVPQVGPGKGVEEPFDFGRARETGSESDLFAFRTPPLRNVAITGPYMHNGVYLTLEEAVRHHLNPPEAVANCDVGLLSPLMQAEDSGDTAVHTAPLSAPSIYLLHKDLSDAEVVALLAFLESLTSPSAANLNRAIPDSVPSGLSVDG